MDIADHYDPLPVTPDELPRLATEVAREYWMVRATGLMLLKSGERLNPILRNVIVQAFNVHVRTLVDFFGHELPSRRPFLDDVVALHFAPDWDRSRHGHVDLIWLESALVPGIQKRTAHLTAYRVRVPADWDAQPIVEIGSALASLMARFLHLLPPERRAWFDLDGNAPDLGWVFRDALGMAVDDDGLRLLLDTEAVPIMAPPNREMLHEPTIEIPYLSTNVEEDRDERDRHQAERTPHVLG